MKYYKYKGDIPSKNMTLLLVLDPGDVIEVDDKEGTVKNLGNGMVGLIPPVNVIGDEKEGITPLCKRLSEGDALFEEVDAPGPVKAKKSVKK